MGWYQVYIYRAGRLVHSSTLPHVGSREAAEEVWRAFDPEHKIDRRDKTYTTEIREL